MSSSRASLLLHAGRSLLLGAALAGLGACGHATADETPAGQPGAYFDLKGFLDGQRKYLESAAPAVTKTVQAGAEPAETQRLTNINWERELQFFYEADLNKPALRGVYTVSQTALPGGGRRTVYQRRADENAPIRELVVETGPAGTVSDVRAEQDTHNFLFAGNRHLALHCDPAPDHNRLLTYEVRGRQKLVFLQEATYAVRGEVE